MYPIGGLAGPGADPVCCPPRHGMWPSGRQALWASRRRSPRPVGVPKERPVRAFEEPRPSGGAESGRPNVHVMDLDRPDDHAPETGQISHGGAPYILACGLEGVLQGSEKMGDHRLRRIDAP